ncbi:MAG: SpaH/EbpB family LPXTG-anchored major pilin [Scrofimicrobium sp.]
MSYTRVAPKHKSHSVRFAGSSILVSIAVLILTILGAPGALAEPAPSGEINPDSKTELVITKLEQPDKPGARATGLPQDPDVIGAMTPIPGVTFTAKLVPGVDITTPAGWERAATMTAAEARPLVADQPVADTGKTGTDGLLALGGDNGNLGVGLYLIEETDAPAGVISSAPFLVALPLPNPNNTAEWLYTVYVYPKNAVVDVGIAVNDQAAVSCGDKVTWTTSNAIPNQTTISDYVTRNLLAPDVYLDSFDEVTVNLVSAAGGGTALPTLTRGADYTLSEVTVDGQWGFDVTFTKTGRVKMAEARASDPTATVVVTYPTRVTGMGEHTNTVLLYVDDADPVTASTVTKWGALNILVHEKNNPSNVIPGATFKLYLSEADARAGTNPITVGGVSEWTTDNKGFISIGCLRYSDFVNGLDVDSSDPLYRPYYAMPQSYPKGWTGDMSPLAGIVNEVTAVDAQTLVFEVWKGSTPPGPKPPLPDTGVQIAGATLLAAVLLGGGWILRSRKRSDDEDDAQAASDS